jgi:hypothetical protein
MVKDIPTSSAQFRGGVSIYLDRRHYGMKRIRATIPFGRLQIDSDRIELWVIKGTALPSDLPLPLIMPKGSFCFFPERGPLAIGIGFRTQSTVHYFWTYRPSRIMGDLREFGYTECP